MSDDAVFRRWLAGLGTGDDLSRRDFLRLAGAALALAGLDGCTRMPPEDVLPYVRQPVALTPGVPLHYATAMVMDGFATGLVVESHEGRPTKVEGNPEHPASLGATGAMEQASVLQLYDPDRARRIRGGATGSWAELAALLAPARLRARVGARGAGLRLLVEPTSSPTEIRLLQAIEAMYPDAVVHVYAPLATTADGGVEATLLPQYDFGAADVVLSLGADFLASGPFHLRYAHDFAARRAPSAPGGMNRLYVVESDFSPTGAIADHRLARRPSDLEAVASRLLGLVRGGGGGGGAGGATGGAPTSDFGTEEAHWLAAAARDLVAHAGRSVVVAGPRQSERVQALAWAINDALGNVGRTVWLTPSPLFGAGDQRRSLGALVNALDRRTVDTLVIVGGNPAYAAPGRLELSPRIRAARQAIYVGAYDDETARLCAWHVPMRHYLESWGDARAYDGTLSLVQPLVQPLHEGKTAAELLAALAGDGNAASQQLVQATFRATAAGSTEEAWRDAVQRGLVAGSAFPRQATRLPASTLPTPAPLRDGMDVFFAPDPRIHDGRFANNAWLQELPAPLTTLTWDNAAELSPASAARLGVATGDQVVIRVADRELRSPVLVLPGVADDTVVLRFGYGREGAETLASGVGVDAYRLWDGRAYHLRASVAADHGAPARALALTQAHWSLEDRRPARAMTLDEYRSVVAKGAARPKRALTLYEPHSIPDQQGSGEQWAMTIDLARCTGCSACIVACQAENNIPTVGREGVLRRREMHWLRVDRYLSGSAEDPQVLQQPMLCQQCEKAPCEYVCPVEATVHSADGLNEMVYNRCVGTRFCSNNCPYKVRRFNWFDYNGEIAETVAMAKNPDVTVRERGVMEKCTFCVQRIREAEIAAGVAGRPLRGTDVKTACQQACPTQAIVFGSLTEPESDVVRQREDPRAYAALDELGTEPRVRYLAAVHNENPELRRES